jgi:hypothetical protein
MLNNKLDVKPETSFYYEIAEGFSFHKKLLVKEACITQCYERGEFKLYTFSVAPSITNENSKGCCYITFGAENPAILLVTWLGKKLYY